MIQKEVSIYKEIDFIFKSKFCYLNMVAMEKIKKNPDYSLNELFNLN